MGNQKRRDKKGRILNSGERQESDGSYSYRYTDQLGKRKKLTSWKLTEADVTPPGKKDKPSLRKQIHELQVLIGSGVCCENITVIELVERYIKTRVNVRQTTKTGYKTVTNILKKEEFSGLAIEKVKFSDAKLFLIKMQNDGKSYSTIHSVRGVLRPAFQMAFEDRMIPFNPFEFELGKLLINDSVKREAINKKQQRKFLDFIYNDNHFKRYYDAIYILFHTGLRISEFCGLTIHDIDFKEHTLNIERQLQRTSQMVYVIVPTKTNAGTRVLPLTKDVEECFRRIIGNRPKTTIEPIIDGYGQFLYLDKNGMPLVALHWEKYFQHIREKYNKIYKEPLPKITPHVCRHTYCTNMAKTGISVKTLQYLMGHSDINTTLNVYTHTYLEDAQEELNNLDENGKKNAVKSGKKIVNF